MKPDRHALYEIAVQQPELMVGFIEHLYGQMTGRPPVILREDFCGTANLAATWVRSDPLRRATAIDNDATIIRYARQRNGSLVEGGDGRLKLITGDVLACRDRADATVSLNFSHCIYKTRGELLRYFRHARRCLRPGGLFICDIYGGPGAMRAGSDKRRFGDFTYFWEQALFDPITADVVNYIHFAFRDGSRMNRAFTYRWRLWTLPELRELLVEAGFEEPRVCFESEDGFDEDFDAAGVDAWVAYLVCGRKSKVTSQKSKHE